MRFRSRVAEGMIIGSLWDKILLFAIPLAVTGILQQLFNAADVAVVGRFTGDAGPLAMAAVGANSPLIGLLLNTFIGVSLGTNVIIANAVGKGDAKDIHTAVHTSIVLALLCGTALAVLGEIFAEPLLSLQNVPDEVLPYATLYFRVYMLGTPVIMLYNFEAAIFRGIGDTKTPLKVLMFSGVLNVGLNILFVIVFKRTVDGVAAATVISNLVSAVLLLFYMRRSAADIHVELKELRIDKRMLARILQIGVPAGIQSAVFSFANIIIQSAINSLGTVVMAASSAAFNVEIFAYDVLNGFSAACTTIVGQNAGAGKIDRCRRAAVLSWVEGALALAAIISLILFFGHEILGLFNSDQEVIEVGFQRLVIIFFAYAFSLTYEVISGYMRGFGISTMPAILTMIGICGVRLLWIYFVFPMDPSFSTIMTVYPVSLATTAGLMAVGLLVKKPGKRLLKTD